MNSAAHFSNTSRLEFKACLMCLLASKDDKKLMRLFITYENENDSRTEGNMRRDILIMNRTTVSIIFSIDIDGVEKGF